MKRRNALVLEVLAMAALSSVLIAGGSGLLGGGFTIPFGRTNFSVTLASFLPWAVVIGLLLFVVYLTYRSIVSQPTV